VNVRHEEWLQLFVDGMGSKKAYEKLYPNASPATVSVEVSKLRKKYDKQITTAVRQHLSSTAIKATTVIDELLSNPKTQEAVRLKAAIAVLELSGYKAATQIEMKVADVSDNELNTRLSRLLAKTDVLEAEIVGE